MSRFFQQKISDICVSFDVNFNESLTNDIISFEQLGPGLLDTAEFNGKAHWQYEPGY